MKASDVTILKGTIRKVEERNDFYKFSISKKRKIKDSEQFTTFYCSKYKPNDYFKKACAEGNFVELVGSMWSREADGKTWWSYEVDSVLQWDAPRDAAPAQRVEPTKAVEDPDDLPF